LTDKCLDLITVAVPPALPLALSFGMTQSLHRIRSSDKKIFCIRPQKIVEAGNVDSVVFDKTGTLTDDNMICHKIINFDYIKFIQEEKLRGENTHNNIIQYKDDSC